MILPSSLGRGTMRSMVEGPRQRRSRSLAPSVRCAATFPFRGGAAA